MSKGDSARWRVEPGSKVHLDRIDTRSTEGAPGDKKETEAAFAELHAALAGLQERLYAEGEHVFGALNPASCRMASFKVPSEVERSHDFLWRIHAQVPAKGEVVVFNRSQYEDVLVVRVHDLVPEDVWRPRYGLINAFEENLAAAGTRIVKIFLHISSQEQAERFQQRLDDPSTRWKFRTGDLEERARWDAYMAAFEEALTRTSTEDAPWFVVPADRKWYRNWAVSRILLEALEDMDPQYPAGEDLTGVKVT